MAAWRIVDLTQPISRDTWVYPGDPRPRIDVVETGGYRVEYVCMGSHTGTHVDAPAHFIPGGATVDSLDLGRLVAPGVAVSIPRGPMEPVTREDLEAALRGASLRGRFLLLDTGWSRVGGGERARHPYLTLDAAGLLVEEGAVGLGVDTPSPDHSPYPVHRLLLSSGLIIVENLLEPGRLVGTSFLLVVAPLPLAGAGGAPARVYALTGAG